MEKVLPKDIFLLPLSPSLLYHDLEALASLISIERRLTQNDAYECWRLLIEDRQGI